jgi:hypothetical protein
MKTVAIEIAVFFAAISFAIYWLKKNAQPSTPSQRPQQPPSKEEDPR